MRSRLGQISRRYVSRQLAKQLPIDPRQVGRLASSYLTEESLVDYVAQVNAQYQWYRYLTMLSGRLEQVASGELKRLVVFMPPRHGKSELISRIFSAYYLLKYPQKWVGICSYGSTLATTFSRAARANFVRGSGLLSPASQAASNWQTFNGGGMWAAGVGGPITGMGAHVVILDDPVKNAEEAASPAIQLRNQEWYGSTLYTRLEPGAAIILVMTRWADTDLGSYILELEELEPEGWHIMLFPAIAEELDLEALYEARPAFLDTCTIETDYREPGEALAPERFPTDRLEIIKSKLGPYFWRALYQQQPAQQAGAMFKRSWFEIVDTMPRVEGAEYTFVRYWDKAATEGSGAYSVGVIMCEITWHDGQRQVYQYYVCHMEMGQWDYTERELMIQQTAQLDVQQWLEPYGGYYKIWVEQEPGSGGKESAQSTIRGLPGFDVEADPPTGDKTLRARPLQAQAKVGQVKLVRGQWCAAWLFHMSRFPYGQVKDVTDASSGAFNKLSLGGDGLVGVH